MPLTIDYKTLKNLKIPRRKLQDKQPYFKNCNFSVDQALTRF